MAPSGIGTAFTRLMHGMLAGAIGQIALAAIRLILIPLFLAAWGGEIYGQWLMVQGACGFIALADLGLVQWYSNQLTAEWATADRRTFQATLSRLLWVAGMANAAVLLLIVFAIPIVLMAAPVHIGSFERVEFLATATCLAAGSANSLIFGALLAPYSAVGKQALAAYWSSGSTTAGMLLAAAALAYDARPPVIAGCLVAPQILACAILLIDLQHRLLRFRPYRRSLVATTQVRTDVPGGLGFLTVRIAQAISLHGSVLAIGFTLGSATAAAFATLRTVVNLPSQALMILARSAWPEIARCAATRNQAMFTALYALLMRSSYCTMAVFIVITETWGLSLFDRWTGGGLDVGIWDLRAVEIATVAALMWGTNSNALMATNKHQKLGSAYTAAALAGCFGMAFGTCFGSMLAGIILQAIGEALPMTAFTALRIHSVQLGHTIKSQAREFASGAAVIAASFIPSLQWGVVILLFPVMWYALKASRSATTAVSHV